MTGFIALGLYGAPLVRLLGGMLRCSRLRGGLPCGLGPLPGRRVLIGSAVRPRRGLLRGGLLPRLTLARGLTRVEDNDTLNQALAKADKALYVSKNSGKDRFTFR